MDEDLRSALYVSAGVLLVAFFNLRHEASQVAYTLPESVTSDVRRIRSHPLVPGSVAIYGYVYDVKNGQLVEVPEGTRVGQTR